MPVVLQHADPRTPPPLERVTLVGYKFPNRQIEVAHWSKGAGGGWPADAIAFIPTGIDFGGNGNIARAGAIVSRDDAREFARAILVLCDGE